MMVLEWIFQLHSESHPWHQWQAPQYLIPLSSFLEYRRQADRLQHQQLRNPMPKDQQLRSGLPDRLRHPELQAVGKLPLHVSSPRGRRQRRELQAVRMPPLLVVVWHHRLGQGPSPPHRKLIVDHPSAILLCHPALHVSLLGRSAHRLDHHQRKAFRYHQLGHQHQHAKQP